MRHLQLITALALASAACGGHKGAPEPAEPEPSSASATSGDSSEEASSGAAAADGAAAPANEFVLHNAEGPKDQHKKAETDLKPTRTEAAMRFTVVDKDKGPIPGIVVAMTAPDGKKYYTKETNEQGYAEVLVPVGQKYEVVYLALGRKDIAATVPVSDEPNQNVRLTLRYKRIEPERPKVEGPQPGIVLTGVTFDTNKATIRAESFPQLDGVVEYMTYKPSARIQISGHTDNQGNPKKNKQLSQKRAEACRDYLVSKGIDKSRIEAVGYGDERPVAPNDTEGGRQENRRIEAVEL